MCCLRLRRSANLADLTFGRGSPMPVSLAPGQRQIQDIQGSPPDAALGGRLGAHVGKAAVSRASNGSNGRSATYHDKGVPTLAAPPKTVVEQS
jgi:hypothetical protein